MKLNYHFRLSERNKIIVLAFLTLLIIFLLIFLVIIPSDRQIKETKTEIETQREEIEKKYLAGINARILSRKAPEIKEKMERVENVLVGPQEQLEFVTALERMAEENKIEQTPNIEYSSAEEIDFYKKIPLKLSTKGKLLDQLNYLKDLKSLPYFIKIDSVKMKVISDRERENTPLSSDYVSLFIQANSYWKD